MSEYKRIGDIIEAQHKVAEREAYIRGAKDALTGLGAGVVDLFDQETGCDFDFPCPVVPTTKGGTGLISCYDCLVQQIDAGEWPKKTT